MSNKIIKIIFVGDILLHSSYNRIIHEKGPSFVFENVAPIMKDADVKFGNLESVLSKKGTPIYGKGCLVGDEGYISAIKDAGFDVVSLANNHTFDFGLKAYEDMTSRLQEFGIRIIGAGSGLEESRKLLTLDINDLRLGFLAYSSRTTNGHYYATETSPGVAPLEGGYIFEDIKRYKDDVDFLIVSLHWGIEHSPYPTPDQVSLAHEIIDCGVKIVFGNHPQIMQGVERYKNGLIMYSLGNFCHTDYYWEGSQRTYQFKIKPVDRESVMAMIELSDFGIEEIDIIPLWINDHGQPVICEGEKAGSILEKMKERSEMIKRPDFEQYWNDAVLNRRVATPVKIWWSNGNLLYKIKNFKLSQIKTLWELSLMYFQTRFSKDSSKWLLYNPRNDKKPRPFCGDDKEDI